MCEAEKISNPVLLIVVDSTRASEYFDALEDASSWPGCLTTVQLATMGASAKAAAN